MKIKLENAIKKIIKLLKNKKIKYERFIIKNLNNKKYQGIFLIKNKAKFIIKFSFDKYNKNLFFNEVKSYEYLKSKKKHFNISYLKKITNKKNLSISWIKYLDGRKGRYLELNKFFNKKNFKFYSLEINNYFKIIKSNFKLIHNYSIQQDTQYKQILKKYKNTKIKISYSHGDFVHWNSIKTLNRHLVYDLEYFAKKRIFIYDILHWLICPITNKFGIVDYKFNYNFILIIYIKIFINMLGINLSYKEIQMYILLYFFEQKYFFFQANQIDKKYKIISSYNLKKSKLLNNFFSKQIEIFLKY